MRTPRHRQALDLYSIASAMQDYTLTSRSRTMKTTTATTVLILAISASGCTAFRAHSTTVEYAGAIDAESRLALIQNAATDVFGDESKNCAELVLEIYDGDNCVSQHQIASRTGRSRWSLFPCFQFGPLQGRRNEAGQRIWIVDTKSAATVAAWDRTTSAMTGPDATMPNWATIDGGKSIPDADKTNLPRPASCPIE